MIRKAYCVCLEFCFLYSFSFLMFQNIFFDQFLLENFLQPFYVCLLKTNCLNFPSPENVLLFIPKECSFWTQDLILNFFHSFILSLPFLFFCQHLKNIVLLPSGSMASVRNLQSLVCFTTTRVVFLQLLSRYFVSYFQKLNYDMSQNEFLWVCFVWGSCQIWELSSYYLFESFSFLILSLIDFVRYNLHLIKGTHFKGSV